MSGRAHRLEASRLIALHAEAGGARWGVSTEAFEAVLDASLARAFAGRTPSTADIDRYLSSLHLTDLMLACACAGGHEEAWATVLRDTRPSLYRAADALDPTGRARELADAVYGDLFGVREREGTRQSLFRYFHGRSSLATWLRALLAQRHVDALRSSRRLQALPEDDDAAPLRAEEPAPDPSRSRHMAAVTRGLTAALAALEPRDRLRLAAYYVQRLTLAQIGRLLNEHEASVSRHLSRIRGLLRAAIERHLSDVEGMSADDAAEALRSAQADPGAINLAALVGDLPGRKIAAQDRSVEEASR